MLRIQNKVYKKSKEKKITETKLKKIKKKSPIKQKTTEPTYTRKPKKRVKRQNLSIKS